MNDYIEMMKSQGWMVYKRGKGEYCYCTDGTHIAYVQWSDGRPQVSTVHRPNRKTGTGFHLDDRITPDSVRQAMTTFAPCWASSSDGQSVRKYKDWEDFHTSNSFNAELVAV